ncbi:MAG TPA: GTPase HflX, partial [Sphingomicrobium sp.]|nr:GTPase HflX [Sphingomicrobium sp.]
FDEGRSPLFFLGDISHPDSEAQRTDVENVLGQLGVAKEEEGAPPLIEAWNKIDVLGAHDQDAILAEASRREDVVPISAITGSGIDALRTMIAEKLRSGTLVQEVRVPVSDGSTIAWLHSRGDVIGQETRDSEVHLKVRLSPENWARFQSLQSA